MQTWQDWWINNRHRFWAIRWAWSRDPYQAVEEWQEYKYMSNPDDDRSFVEQVIQDYAADVDAALRNPIVKLACWMRVVWNHLQAFRRSL